MSSGNCLIDQRTQNWVVVLGCKNSVLPQGVKEIGDYAFAGCTNLTSITIPGSVVTIGESAFEDCRGLTSFIMQSGLQTIGNNALKNCSGITNLSIPDSVTSIGNYAFYGLGFTSVTVPGGVLSIGQNAFGGNNLTAINVDTGNTCYYSRGGVLFGAEGVLLSCPSAKSGNYDIPDGTTEIGDYAFYGCWQLTGITIINNVTSIGEYAFWGCTQLAYITISADSVLESIGSSAFFECFGVSEITIPQSVTFIGATAFGDWTEDQTIVMNVDVSFVWQWDVDWALQCYAQINWGGNSAIATEGLQYTLTNVGYEVSVGSSLSDNDNNGTVVIPAVYNGYPVVGVAESGFFDCQGLVKVMFIGNNLMYIGNNAFAGCSNLTAINIPHGVTHIGQMAFCGCSQLQSIYLPQTIEEIYCTAFKECDNLKSIMIQGGLTYIEVDTFDEINEYTIYTENGSDNPEWHFINFSPSCVVFYNCTFSVDGAFVVSILVQGENYVNANPTAPCREGYVFAGWTTTLGGDVEYDMEDAVSGAISDTVLYAVWEPAGE
ncbi:MAG: leucine-rich repeat protein [Christensenellales bacterium]